MSTVDPLVSFVETLKFGDFPKLLRLCEDKFTKNNRTTWSKRSEDKKMKYITCLSKVVNIVSGGETKECLEDFARGKRAKAFITSALQGAAKTDLAEKDINNLLHNLMVVYRRLQNKGRPQDACRLMILQALHGVRGIKVLRGLGWEIGDDTWSKVGRTITWSAEASDRASTREEKKGKTGDSCRAVQRFTEDSLRDAQQKELQDECSAHGLSITPPNKDLRARLRAHYNALQHSHKPAGASSDQATTYYSESLSAVNPELVERAAARTINTIASLFAKRAAKEV